jgi:hypothetical protein
VGEDGTKNSVEHETGCNKSSAHPSTREAAEASHDIFVFSEVRDCLHILFGESFNVPRKRKNTVKYVTETSETETGQNNASHNKNCVLHSVGIARKCNCLSIETSSGNEPSASMKGGDIS